MDWRRPKDIPWAEKTRAMRFLFVIGSVVAASLVAAVLALGFIDSVMGAKVADAEHIVKFQMKTHATFFTANEASIYQIAKWCTGILFGALFVIGLTDEQLLRREWKRRGEKQNGGTE